MAQKIEGYIKLQIPAGKATPAPPVGPALGQHGVNIMAFTKDFNERTKNDIGTIIPVVITVYADHSFTFITKTPPAAVLIKKECSLEKASGRPNTEKVAVITLDSLKKIAAIKKPDLNAASEEAAVSMLAGTARSMGIVVDDGAGSAEREFEKAAELKKAEEAAEAKVAREAAREAAEAEAVAESAENAAEEGDKE